MVGWLFIIVVVVVELIKSLQWPPPAPFIPQSPTEAQAPRCDHGLPVLLGGNFPAEVETPIDRNTSFFCLSVTTCKNNTPSTTCKICASSSAEAHRTHPNTLTKAPSSPPTTLGTNSELSIPQVEPIKRGPGIP